MDLKDALYGAQFVVENADSDQLAALRGLLEAPVPVTA